MRTLKTAARKALGLDGRFKQALQRRLSVPALPSPQLMQMDAERMSFPDASFEYDRINQNMMAMMHDAIARLRVEGEVAEYTEEELLTINFISIWRKPA